MDVPDGAVILLIESKLKTRLALDAPGTKRSDRLVAMTDLTESRIVAVGTWLYDGSVPRKIELLARPAEFSKSRWFEDEQTGEFVLNESAPVPQTDDGFVYYVGATSGGEFLRITDAIAWADQQAWGPVEWVMLPTAT
jgi:hypothetical protein